MKSGTGYHWIESVIVSVSVWQVCITICAFTQLCSSLLLDITMNSSIVVQSHVSSHRRSIRPNHDGYNHRVVWQNHGYLPCFRQGRKFASRAWFGPYFTSIMSRIAIHILFIPQPCKLDYKIINLALPSFFESTRQINVASARMS